MGRTQAQTRGWGLAHGDRETVPEIAGEARGPHSEDDSLILTSRITHALDILMFVMYVNSLRIHELLGKNNVI